ncbi:MAG: nitrite/sulfite reductase [Bryobacteraceae bacterium]|nr:nitrite/sulfite reductase [Bryobacteraceae bacterium]
MKASNQLWKARLEDRLSAGLGAEIDVFEHELALRRQGKIDERVFAETRLRRGVYGQRYDNGQRHDGRAAQVLAYPERKPTKGPHTLWDAPGMQRIKIPFGGLDAAQLETVADLSEEYSDGIAHVTTRQDFQLHYVHIDDTPALMRRLAAAGITTREACGNSIRNVTACPLAGVCRDQTFDVTAYAKMTAYYLLGHPECQDFGRKFKIAFSGCKTNPCALVRMHDLGAIAATREVDGEVRRGFEIYVGGGLGTVPYQAQLFTDFLPVEELLPLCIAIARVYSRLGEKKNRNTARIKFLVNRLGLEEFRRLVFEERAALSDDPKWAEALGGLAEYDEGPSRPAGLLEIGPAQSEEFRAWRARNVYQQRQAGYATVTIALPLGDITAAQLRVVADVARQYTRETIRTTVEQNLVLRWLSEADLPAVYSAFQSAGLAEPLAGTIVDIAACPGTDTCKLGIASSRGLAAELRTRLLERGMERDEAIGGLRIKISGCFNSCGQHHVADIGFYGVSRNKNGYTVPHFQVLLGGQWDENAGAYGLAIGAVPSKRIPEALERITGRYVAERRGNERFQEFIKRIGKAECKRMIEDFAAVPPHDQDASFYTDWSDAREFTVGDIGVGECAGEVVSPVDFQLAACEREAFEAQLQLEAGQVQEAAQTAYQSMMHGAQALLRLRLGAPPEDAERVAAEFRTHFYDTQLFFDPFAQGKFAQYYFMAHERNGAAVDEDAARRRIEEAQLFLEAAHSCYGRIMTAQRTF